MKLNAGKCHFMCYGKNRENETFLCDKSLTANDNEKNLGVIIDNKFNFKSHIN